MTAIAFLKPVVTLQGRVANGNQQFTRGQQVAVSVTFYDASGNVVTPASATLTLSYRTVSDGCRTHSDYALTQSGNNWTYTWDSSIAQRSAIFGHIQTGDKAYAVDFSFRLLANLASLELYGDDDFFHYIT